MLGAKSSKPKTKQIYAKLGGHSNESNDLLDGKYEETEQHRSLIIETLS